MEYGVVIKTVHRKIDYQATKIFMRFVEQVTETRRTGDVDKSKAQLAEVFKLLRNSSCGNPIEAAGAANMRYFQKDEKVVDRVLRNPLSWKAGSRVSRSEGRSRSESSCISWQS